MGEDDENEYSVIKILVTDLIFCSLANTIGFCLNYINEISCRRAFLDKHASIHSNLILEHEKVQEARLMLTMLPDHIMSSVREELHDAVDEAERIPRAAIAMKRKPFSNVYVKEHPEASILVADIVNFTPLTTALSVQDLVALLNEMYNRFDDEAKRIGCERIKILGDCYCCVSGVPNPSDKHAENCVRMGLYMIQGIREIRERHKESAVGNIDMRIGVHSGSLHSGLIGIKKWQYDVWSKDVDLATDMERTGKAGHVHITEATKSLLPLGLFTFLPGELKTRDPELASSGVVTYFVKPPKFEPGEESSRMEEESSLSRDSIPIPSLSLHCSLSKKRRHKSSAEATFEEVKESLEMRRLTALLYSSLQHYRLTTHEATNEALKEEIESMPLDYVSTCLNPDRIYRFTMVLKTWKEERRFLTMPDPVFKMSLIGVGVLVLGILSNELITQHNHRSPSNVEFSANPTVVTYVFIGVLAIVTVLSWYRTIKKTPLELYTPTKRGLYSLLTDFSDGFTTKLHYRLLVFVIITTFLVVISCSTTSSRKAGKQPILNNITFFCNDKALYTNLPGSEKLDSNKLDTYFILWHYQWYTHALALTCIFVLRYFHHTLKFLTGLGILVAQAFCISRSDEDIPWDSKTVVLMIKDSVILLITLLVIDRQEEYVRRLEFVWKERIMVERKEAGTTSVVNRILLANIMPKHIVDLYLTQRNQYVPVSHLHAQEPCNVAVMFASMPNFSSSCQDIGTQKDILKLLNEYISEFDMLLFQPNFWGVEKIKLVGSTYMAACGLSKINHMWKNENMTDDERRNEEINNLVTMAKFAFTMIKEQQKLNPDTYQSFGLRIGINWGPVVAGVVGAQKPFYDIWGDTVNVASRMESHGVSGRIHMKEECALILRNQGFRIEYRGRITLKGKGVMETYFIDPQTDQEIETSSRSSIDSSSFSRTESISNDDKITTLQRNEADLEDSNQESQASIQYHHRIRIDEGLGQSISSHD